MLRIAGVDEAGRGPWAGPVVAAAVILRTGSLSVRIDDSKRLSARQRERAFRAILRQGDIGVGIACAEEIDQRNILQATLHAMAQALRELPEPPDLVLIDGTQTPPVSFPCQAIPHGDHLSYPISCASIVAKVLRDEMMRFYDRLYPHFSFHQHKGYGTQRHAEALERWGPSFLHRRSFEPVEGWLLMHGQP